jgi:hypothetical protein
MVVVWVCSVWVLSFWQGPLVFFISGLCFSPWPLRLGAGCILFSAMKGSFSFVSKKKKKKSVIGVTEM